MGEREREQERGDRAREIVRGRERVGERQRYSIDKRQYVYLTKVRGLRALLQLFQ